MKMRYNIFLTGPAGSGKTFVLNEYIRFLKKEKTAVAITASTGLAATHIGGMTIHSWCGMGVKEFLNQNDLKKLSRNGRVKKRMKKTEVLIIDEISMLHAFQLDMVDQICRHFKDPFLPFGGMQVVLCGDFFQLPPIQRDRSKQVQFVFGSQVWNKANMHICYLDEQHRQKDSRMTELLNGIRAGEVEQDSINNLTERLNIDFEGDEEPLRLHTHNVDVDRINISELGKINSPSKRYHMHVEGNEKLAETLKGGCLAPEELVLKQGAKVMFVKNNFDAGYINGTTGIVVGFDEESKIPIVQKADGKKITAHPEEWIFEDQEVVLARIKQIPLRLAWAITVHKSQGMSLDFVEIDLSRAFEFGMGYVALSRVRTLDGMRLLGINEMSLIVNPDIIAMDKDLQIESEKFSQELAVITQQEKEEQQKRFLKKENSKKVGGEKAYDVGEVRKTFQQAYMPWTKEDDLLLAKLFDGGRSIEELAKHFKRKNGAIRSRIEKIIGK